MPFELPKLKYGFSDLEPYIDSATVEIHYSKHHQTYTTNLNKALDSRPEYAEWSIEKLLQESNSLPEDVKTVIRNNGGGYFNHNLYWATISPDAKKEPTGKLGESIITTFGSFSDFKTQMTHAALTRFGSGWGWLADNNGVLSIYSTPNQDSPLLSGHTPLLGVDVWEHAYYLKYQNRRNEYIENWWNLVDWEEVEKLYSQI